MHVQVCTCTCMTKFAWFIGLPLVTLKVKHNTFPNHLLPPFEEQTTTCTSFFKNFNLVSIEIS